MRDPSELARIAVNSVKVALHPHNENPYAVLEGEGRQVLFPLNFLEASNLTFTTAGCSQNAYVNTINQLFLGAMRDHNKVLKDVVIEAKDGDVYHGRLRFEDKEGRSYLATCGAGDALVLSLEAHAQLYVLRTVWDDMDEFDQDWPADHVTVDE